MASQLTFTMYLQLLRQGIRRVTDQGKHSRTCKPRLFSMHSLHLPGRTFRLDVAGLEHPSPLLISSPFRQIPISSVNNHSHVLNLVDMVHIAAIAIEDVLARAMDDVYLICSQSSARDADIKLRAFIAFYDRVVARALPGDEFHKTLSQLDPGALDAWPDALASSNATFLQIQSLALGCVAIYLQATLHAANDVHPLVVKGMRSAYDRMSAMTKLMHQNRVSSDGLSPSDYQIIPVYRPDPEIGPVIILVPQHTQYPPVARIQS